VRWHEIAVLRRNKARPRLDGVGRAVLAALIGHLPRGRGRTSWSRQAPSRGGTVTWPEEADLPDPDGTTPVSVEIIALIGRLATGEPRLGYQRIQGELLNPVTGSAYRRSALFSKQ
jgi:putative transposase